jgi:methylisocitrate lyase
MIGVPDSLIHQKKKMADQRRKAEQFRALHIPGKPLVLFNIWDAGSAKGIAAGGAKAIATGSWSVANANGFADGERIPLAFAIDNLRRIVGATDLPVTIDLESGYGDAPEVVGEAVALAIDAGAVGCNLEDSFPANGNRKGEPWPSSLPCGDEGAGRSGTRGERMRRTG